MMILTQENLVDHTGMDKGSGVVDEGLVGAGNTLVLHVSVVLGVGGNLFHSTQRLVHQVNID